VRPADGRSHNWLKKSAEGHDLASIRGNLASEEKAPPRAPSLVFVRGPAVLTRKTAEKRSNIRSYRFSAPAQATSLPRGLVRIRSKLKYRMFCRMASQHTSIAPSSARRENLDLQKKMEWLANGLQAQ
jgi:hypothetical protein